MLLAPVSSRAAREPRACAVSLAAALLLGACGGTATGDRGGEGARIDPNANRPASCPARAPALELLPGVTAEHRTVDYWIERAASYGDVDAVLLSQTDIIDHNEGLKATVDERPLGQSDLTAPLDRALLEAEVTERLAFMHDKLATGQYVDESGERVDPDIVARLAPRSTLPAFEPELRLAEAAIPLRCGPTDASFYTEALDLRFDRNNCSTAREGELVQLLSAGWGDMRLARTAYSLGWIRADAALSEPLSEERARAATARQNPQPLTRRAFLESAFALLDAPYGWGGEGSGRDCSRFVLDVFEELGLGLPRHSGRQAIAGTFSIDVSDVPSEREKLLLIESATQRGIVLLSFPGHIMAYLGRDAAGTPMALHAFAEYLEACPQVVLPDDEPAEILRTVDRITVSDLELGRGTTRTAFLERIDRITVFGRAPGLELVGVASLRPVAPVSPPAGEEACTDSQAAALFRSPAQPHPGQPMRVIATLDDDPGPVELVLIGPDGTEQRPPVKQLGGPPFTYWAEIDRPAPGRWTAVLGDGQRRVACERFTVARGGPAGPEPSPHAWTPRWRWENDTENLFAAFVEQLFDYPPDEDLTWPNLQTLLSDRSRNLLHGHLGFDEDRDVRLEPDCADLPYFLRAYFAWKTRLPFAFRRCSRGRASRPPTCGDLNTNLAPRAATGDAPAFAGFARDVMNGVHSATARTVPRAEATDLYPVPLSRAALRPGTVYADPYGHLLVVAEWIPQGMTSYGIMIAADAQPDGTIGRRRFWRGSFLFTPDTTDVGAGFKAWRPLSYDRGTDTITALDNDMLARTTEHAPYSEEQYAESADDFYDRMEALINPRPLDPEAVQRSLVDALDESVARRIVSINNGIEYMNGRRWATIEMPTGYSVFETTGAWEDYSTPARDLRLLISIDAVTGFADSVVRSPDRFALSEEEAARTASDLRQRLPAILAERRFEYTASDGTPRPLTLRDVVERAVAFEMAYNPNDCVEIRWAAPADSEEMALCRRNAPPEQRRRMESYRSWFENRRRPPR